MKRLVCVLLLFALLFTASCGEWGRSFDETEVCAAAKTLIQAAKPLNTVFYGEGLPFYWDESQANGRYYPADPIAARELGFETLDELREKTKEVFSAGFSQQIFSTKFSSITDESGIRGLSRYYQKTEKIGDKEEPVCIMVYADAQILFTDEIRYDFSTLKALGSSRERVYVSLNYTVTNREGKSQTGTMRVTLVEEDNGWRLDSPTFANYSEAREDYQNRDSNP